MQLGKTLILSVPLFVYEINSLPINLSTKRNGTATIQTNISYLYKKSTIKHRKPLFSFFTYKANSSTIKYMHCSLWTIKTTFNC